MWLRHFVSQERRRLLSRPLTEKRAAKIPKKVAASRWSLAMAATAKRAAVRKAVTALVRRFGMPIV
jgi:hypothetical protein